MSFKSTEKNYLSKDPQSYINYEKKEFFYLQIQFTIRNSETVTGIECYLLKSFLELSKCLYLFRNQCDLIFFFKESL